MAVETQEDLAKAYAKQRQAPESQADLAKAYAGQQQPQQPPPPPNAGLAPPAGPSRQLIPAKPGPGAKGRSDEWFGGESGLPAALTSFATQLSNMPRGLWEQSFFGELGNPRVRAMHEQQQAAEKAAMAKPGIKPGLSYTMGLASPIARTDKGTPAERIDWGATGANLLPYAFDAAIQRGGYAGDVVRNIGRTQKMIKLSTPADVVTDVSESMKQLNALDDTSQTIFNRIRSRLNTLQEHLSNNALNSMRPVIEADKYNPKPVLTETAGREVADRIKATDYQPKPAEAKVLDRLGGGTAEQRVAKSLGYTVEQMHEKVAPDAVRQLIAKENGPLGGGLSLEDAIHLRTALREAMIRATERGKPTITAGYDELTAAIGDRVNEIQGLPEGTKNNAWNQYNKNFTAYFQNKTKGFTPKYLDQVLDPHDSRNLVGDFGGENLKGVLQQMRDNGMNTQEFAQLQESALQLTKVRQLAAARGGRGIMSMLRNPQENMPQLAAFAASRMAGAYGLVPYIAATLADRASGGLMTSAKFGEVIRRLGLPEDIVREAETARVQPGPFKEPQITQGPAPAPPGYEPPKPAATPTGKPAAPQAKPYVPGELTRQVTQSIEKQAAKARAAKPRYSAAEVSKSLEEARRAEAESLRAERERQTAAREEEQRARQRKEMELLSRKQRLTPRQLDRSAREGSD